MHRANTGLRVSASNGVDGRRHGLYCLRLWEWLAVPPGANNKLSLPLAGDMHHVAARAPARVALHLPPGGGALRRGGWQCAASKSPMIAYAGVSLRA